VVSGGPGCGGVLVQSWAEMVCCPGDLGAGRLRDVALRVVVNAAALSARLPAISTSQALTISTSNAPGRNFGYICVRVCGPPPPSQSPSL